MASHSALLIPMLQSKLPSTWTIKPIDKLNENQVAEILGESSIFLAFSDFEGLPVPPVEAALSGNFVVGYTGQGGKEYWNRPVFTEIHSGDIVSFFNASCNIVDSIDRGIASLHSNLNNDLKFFFSKNNEINMLSTLVEIIHDL